MEKLLSFLTGPIIDGVLKGIAEMRAIKQFEAMQAEVLEGWVFKMKVRIERALKKHDVKYEVYRSVMDSIDDVVKEEFDTRRI